ncbi:TonB-dependent receptor [Sphingobium yanoikuyae]|uniref:TonB-dependent receptor-like protein n=1 Tax=Sphingobium yanoikuyae TaxID=13690 RepID=A0A291N0G2_SPHYA|nr:TonB-dependent receptor [Sphingobium yanoikuyae]ATI80837.1 TonB-dependent receptor-like protein [Sphingobium yanoikuyae]
MKSSKTGLLAGTAAALLALSPCAMAQDRGTRTYDLPAQDLRYALRAVARGAGFQLIADPSALKGKTAAPLRGDYRLEEALAQLLDGTQLSLEISEGTVIVRGRGEPPQGTLSDLARNDIVVTGSRIRGAEIASKTISLGREAMKDAGLATLADAMQTIPQNFGGGQNPGVGLNVPESTGVSHGSASSINLRGLGSDATLTLLNGHRLAYNFAFQAIDISSIPFEAIDRIELVADGSSALYGSDAVAGVANILLRRDYDGLKASARLGGSSDGGNVQQQYGLLAGQQWNSGGVLLAGEFARTTPIVSAQRDYSEDSAPGLYLAPFIKRYSLLASGHQGLGGDLQFTVDALYNKRSSYSQYAYDARGDVMAYGSTSDYDSESLVVAPSLAWTLPGSWQVSLSGMIGFDRTHYAYDIFYNSASIFQQIGCYCNKARSMDFAADGNLFNLPGGAAKLALGGGYRINKFHGYRADGSQDIRAKQDAWFGYGEINLPLVGPDQGIGAIYRFNLSGALRYENYPDVDKVVTPKLGLVYAPVDGLEIKASWGKSFRAPTLYQQYNQVFVNNNLASTMGGASYPAGSTALLLTGGNRDLKPERATSWSTTLDLQPVNLPGLRLEASYFNVRYRDRIVTPIQYSSRSLSDPLYGEFVELSPTASQIDATIDRADVFTNVAGGLFDPARVVAIIDNSNINAARQSLQGVDISLRYATDVAGGKGGLSLEASYLDSEQTLSSLQPETQRSGTLFNPPKWRGRAGLNWGRDGLGLSFFANYVGKLWDVRRTPSTRIGATTTFDGNLRFASPEASGPLRGIDVIFAIQNMFNKKPPLIRTTQVWEAPYDSTNYSAVGRFISLSIAKSW